MSLIPTLNSFTKSSIKMKHADLASLEKQLRYLSSHSPISDIDDLLLLTNKFFPLWHLSWFHRLFSFSAKFSDVGDEKSKGYSPIDYSFLFSQKGNPYLSILIRIARILNSQEIPVICGAKGTGHERLINFCSCILLPEHYKTYMHIDILMSIATVDPELLGKYKRIDLDPKRTFTTVVFEFLEGSLDYGFPMDLTKPQNLRILARDYILPETFRNVPFRVICSFKGKQYTEMISNGKLKFENVISLPSVTELTNDFQALSPSIQGLLFQSFLSDLIRKPDEARKQWKFFTENKSARANPHWSMNIFRGVLYPRFDLVGNDMNTSFLANIQLIGSLIFRERVGV